MSQNDFTIANQGFPAFRADLNSALQALASNSSGTSAPSTTFANMWWYDTSNNIMYIRNEDNDAWIKFAELDQTNDKFVLSGTLQLDDGTVSAPALTFNSDTNMGIYRGGTDILKFVTAGTDAITINASQNVGIGTSPSHKLEVHSANATNVVAKSTNGNGGFLNYSGLSSGGTTTFSVTHNGNVYAADGINLGGTGSANKLNDVETGTFTPTLLAATTNPTVTYTSGTVGTYTKIGNTVHVFIRVNTTAVSGGSGTALIGGLPFATDGTYRSGGALGYISGVSLNSGFTQFGLNPDAGASTIRLVQSGSGVGANIISIGSVANSFDITLTHTYRV